MYKSYIDGLVQDCSNSSALAQELLQSCTKLLVFTFFDTLTVEWFNAYTVRVTKFYIYFIMWRLSIPLIASSQVL